MLSQKCAILDVLRQLAEYEHDGGVDPQSANDNSRAGTGRHNDEGSVFRDALPSAGAPNSSTRDSYMDGRGHGAINGTMAAHGSRQPGLGSKAKIQPGMNNAQDSHPTEAELLHDLPFTLQGLSTNHLPFADHSTLKLPPTLPIPLVSLLHSLAEPSLLYRSLSEFVQSSDEGLIGQSLRAAISNELRSYLGLIATLEGEIRRAITSMANSESKNSMGRVDVTLKRCVIWTRDATMGLRLMSLMVEQAKSK